MGDSVSPEVRSRIMRAIKGKDTGPERALGAALVAAGVAYWQPRKGELPGSPDFCVQRRLAVFCHGCFWHSCPRHGKAPKLERWRLHLARNRRRDLKVRRQLRALGWATMVVWEHENMARAADRVVRRLERMGV